MNFDEIMKKCCICSENYACLDEVIKYPCECKYIHHKSCLLEWLGYSGSGCPICRKRYTGNYLLQGIYTESNGTSSSRAGASEFFTTTGGVASAFDRVGFTAPWRLYTDTYYCPSETYNTILSAKLNKIIDSGSYFTLLAKRTSKKYHTTHGAYRDTTANYDIFPGEGEYLVDEAPFGFWTVPVSSIEGGITMGGAVSTSRDQSEFTTYELKFDYTNQLNFRHQLKTGLLFHYDNFAINFGSENLFLPGGNYWTIFDRNPYRFTGYVEDKIEYEGFITTLGLVPEMTVFNGKWYDYDIYETAFLSGDYVLIGDFGSSTSEIRTLTTGGSDTTIVLSVASDFAHFLGMILKGEKLYLLEKEGYIIEINKELSQYDVFSVDVEDGYVFSTNKKFFIDNEYISIEP